MASKSLLSRCSAIISQDCLVASRPRTAQRGRIASSTSNSNAGIESYETDLWYQLMHSQSDWPRDTRCAKILESHRRPAGSASQPSAVRRRTKVYSSYSRPYRRIHTCTFHEPGLIMHSTSLGNALLFRLLFSPIAKKHSSIVCFLGFEEGLPIGHHCNNDSR
jgi:hypothetical protein